MNGMLVIAAAVMAVAPTVSAAQTIASHDSPSVLWVATWTAPPMLSGSALAAPRALEDQTVRNVVHVSVGG